MPSPFPGMDPYLESVEKWGGLHHLLITSTVAQLQPALNQRGYYADPGERVWLSESERTILPDVVLARGNRSVSRVAPGGTLVADEPVRVRREEFREPFIDIRDSATHRVIAGIEFISPSNKLSRDGRKLYRRKQRDTQKHGIHLVEIDLTRRGSPIVDLPIEILRAEKCDYLANLVRHRRLDFEYYPIHLRDRLPKIRLPLRAGDEDAVLDLQQAFDDAYDTGPYAVRVDYSIVCDPPFGELDAEWANELLKIKGLRG